MSNNSNSPDNNQQAIALKYEQKKAPTVVAKGHGDIAEQMLALAKQHDVLIHQDEELSAMLSHLDLGQEIPDSLYHVIAELIAFSYVLQGKFPDSWKNVHSKIDHKT